MTWLLEKLGRRKPIEVETAEPGPVEEKKGLVSPAWEKLVRHPANLADYEKYYRSDSEVHAAVNVLADMSVGVGYFTECENDRAKEIVDILLCDSDEKNFLIMEIKNGDLNREDIEQAEKYIQLVNQRFPNNVSVSANVIGLRNTTLTGTQRVKLVKYEIKAVNNKATVTFTPNV